MRAFDPSPEPASYRDRAGRVHVSADGRIFRTVAPCAKDDFDYVEQSGLAAALMEEGALSRYRLADVEIAAAFPGAAYVLEHEPIPFISYPYEWGFDALKAAALRHLDLHLHCLRHGVTLSDASAFNIQFIGARPVFIDRLSLIRYREGAHWQGHRQFCEQFLAPLLLWSRVGVTHHALFRGDMEGVKLATLHALMPRLKTLSLRYAMHVGLPAWGDALRSPRLGNAAHARPLPKAGLVFMLRDLRRWVASLEPAKRLRGSQWKAYRSFAPYAAEEAAAKRDAVAAFIEETRPRMLWDLGCNDGEYARLALQHGAEYVVGFDSDAGALRLAHAGAKGEGLSFLPLTMDMANPSPDQGWRGCERKSLTARANADALLALALLHHMAIGRNIPLKGAVEWLVSLAPRGAIEWVEKSDPMVRRLLATRADIFDDYTKENFTAALTARARITKEAALSATRTLYCYER